MRSRAETPCALPAPLTLVINSPTNNAQRPVPHTTITSDHATLPATAVSPNSRAALNRRTRPGVGEARLAVRLAASLPRCRLAAVRVLRISELGAALSLVLALAPLGRAAAQDAPPVVVPAAPSSPPAVAPPVQATPVPQLPAGAAGTPQSAAPGVEPPPDVETDAAVEPELEPVVETEAGDDSDGSHPSLEKLIYVLERVEVTGNRMDPNVIRRFVPFKPGDALDVEDSDIERTRFRLLGTGWFNDVRLRLRRGSQRGRVVLVLDVTERNTLTVSRVFAGLARVVDESGTGSDALRPYAGLGLFESNFLGEGIGVGVTGVFSEAQLGLDLLYHDPLRLGAGFDLSGRLFYNDAREFFGRNPDVIIDCPEPEPVEEGEDPEPCDPDVRAKRAVVIYDRFGLGIGTGHEITSALRYEIDWLGELVEVNAKPFAAFTARGQHDEDSEPIDFHIDDRASRVSSLHLGLIFDRRDDPALPARGQIVRFDARIGTGLLASSYDFARIEVSGRQFVPLPWGHVINFGLFFGTVFGNAPFFYRFYAADLSDLLPSRALELNLDHRRTHNLFDTSIREFDKEDFAARIDFEYQLPLHRGGGDVRGVDAYAGAGVFLLAERDALRTGLPGYEGFERWPLDLTFDLGVQADTAIGVFRIGFSSFIGFLPDFGRERP